MIFNKRDIKSPKLTVEITIELTNSTLTPEEAKEKIEHIINSHYDKEFSSFIAMLICKTNSSMWELGKIEVK